jgi:hypothetical protein
MHEVPVTTPVRVQFGEQEDKDLHKFVKENLQAMLDAYDKFHNSKIPEWRKLYKGQPENESRDWPWPNASNVVIQLIAENVDILKARIIGTIYEILPLWVSHLVGEWPTEENGDDQRQGLEDFMNLMGMEPNELDLYRVESLAANDICQFGSVLIKQPWETDVEKLVTGPSVDGRGEPAATELTRYDGPRPEKVPIEDWGATVNAPTWEKADFKYNKYTLNKQQIEQKIFQGLFYLSNEDEKKLLASPDRYGPDNTETQKQRNQNIEAQQAQVLALWDIYECWFWYWHNNSKWRIVYLYHKGTDTKCNAIFNFYPSNDEPFEFGRLGYTDDGLLGYGFAEMLKFYQEEVTTGHNQRNDNRTLGNTSVITVGKNNKIDANMAVYPMAVLPILTEEFGIHQLGVAYPSSVQEEQLTLELAKARAGVDSGMQAMGGDTVGKKGQLSAMGTFSVMQSGNRRVNVNITDFRYLHLKLGRKAARMYAEFGVGERLKYFGNQAGAIKKALENIKNGRIDLPIRAANASINKELEKQNDMLLTQVMQRHHATIAQILTGLGNPQMTPELKFFLVGVIGASGHLMSKLLRNFGHDDIARLQPELDVVKMLKGANQNANNRQSQEGEGPKSLSTPFPVSPGQQNAPVQANVRTI